MKNEVFLFKCNSYEEDISSKAINELISSFDVLKNIKEGTKVVIKANLVSAMTPDKSATTHPVLLKHLVTYLLSKKCLVTIGDSPGGLYTSSFLNHVYKITKMNETGADLNNNFATKKVLFKEAKLLKSFEYTAYLDDADLLIDFCKLKTHGMMGMSAAVKNLFGTIPGTIKTEYHYRFPNHEDFANMLIDINEYFKPAISIVDAVIGMEGNGPTMGSPRKIGVILASENQYALDYICSKIIGINERNVETINQSIKRKLFSVDKVTTNIPYDDFIIKNYKLIQGQGTITFFDNKKGPINRLLSKASNKLFANRPNPIKKKCIGCGKCAEVCPMKAISIKDKKAVIDTNKCIKCYCCQEFCPVGAMVVKSSLVMKIINHKKKPK